VAVRASLLLTLTLTAYLARQAAPDVLSDRHDFQVIRANAVSHTAQVIERHPDRNRTVQLLPREAMRGDRTALKPELAVAIPIDCALPEDAAVRAWSDEAGEACSRWDAHSTNVAPDGPRG